MEKGAGKRVKRKKNERQRMDDINRMINMQIKLHKQCLFQNFLDAKYYLFLAVDFAKWKMDLFLISLVRFTHLFLKWCPGTCIQTPCLGMVLRRPCGRRVWWSKSRLTRNSDLNHPWLVLSSPEEQAVWILDLTLISWEHVVQPSVTHVERRQTTLELNMLLVGQLRWSWIYI